MVNVSRVVLSQRLGTQKIEVQRSSGKWVEGKFIMGEPSIHFLYSFVTVASPKDLEQIPEGDRRTGSMKFLTVEPLKQNSDIVIWRGSKFKIMGITSDIDYGFYRSIGVRLDGDSIG